MRALLCSLALITLANCAHTKEALLIGGASIQTTGEQFVVVAETMNVMLEKKEISNDKYMQWAEFAKKFQAVYPAAIHIWRMARLANDLYLEQKAADMIIALMPDLIKFASEVGVVIEDLKQ